MPLPASCASSLRSGSHQHSPNPLVATAMVYGVLLLAFHVQADGSVTDDMNIQQATGFFDRLKKGPANLSQIDLILFGAFFLLAFELLQFLVEGSGRKCLWYRLVYVYF